MVDEEVLHQLEQIELAGIIIIINLLIPEATLGQDQMLRPIPKEKGKPVLIQLQRGLLRPVRSVRPQQNDIHRLLLPGKVLPHPAIAEVVAVAAVAAAVAVQAVVVHLEEETK